MTNNLFTGNQNNDNIDKTALSSLFNPTSNTGTLNTGKSIGSSLSNTIGTGTGVGGTSFLNTNSENIINMSNSTVTSTTKKVILI